LIIDIKYAAIRLLFCIIIILLFVTNPTMAEFTEWTINELTGQIHAGLTEELTGTFGNTFLKSITIKHDYLLFSIFEIKYNKKNVRILGILRFYIPLSDINVLNKPE